MTRIATWQMQATGRPAAAGKGGASAGLSQGPARIGRRASITDDSYVRVPSLPNICPWQPRRSLGCLRTDPAVMARAAWLQVGANAAELIPVAACPAVFAGAALVAVML